MKCRSLTELAIHPDLPAHHFHKAAGDGQTKAGAAIFTSGGGIGLGKGLKYALQFLFGDSNASVRHNEVQRVAAVLRRARLDLQRNLSLTREFDCVANKIHDDLAQPIWITAEKLRDLRPHVAQELKPLLIRPQCQRLQCRFQALAQIKVKDFKFHLAGFDL